jgi:hypothetical protein
MGDSREVDLRRPMRNYRYFREPKPAGAANSLSVWRADER